MNQEIKITQISKKILLVLDELVMYTKKLFSLLKKRQMGWRELESTQAYRHNSIQYLQFIFQQLSPDQDKQLSMKEFHKKTEEFQLWNLKMISNLKVKQGLLKDELRTTHQCQEALLNIKNAYIPSIQSEKKKVNLSG